MERFGLVPDFKVGFHHGAVMVGELGQIKRDIAFSGDVLNTAARIQAKCNELGVKILASHQFAEMNKPLPADLMAEDLGSQSLKGKAQPISLVTFRYES